MLRRLFSPATSLLLIALPVSLSAKGDTIKITITGTDLKSQIEITDPAVLTEFKVWGPLIVESFQYAMSSAPQGFPTYEVSFYSEFGKQTNKLSYVVLYEYDPSTDRGWVYLPGKGEKWHWLDVGSIYHGVEGNWFITSSSWDDVAIPLIEKARLTTSTLPKG